MSADHTTDLRAALDSLAVQTAPASELEVLISPAAGTGPPDLPGNSGSADVRALAERIARYRANVRVLDAADLAAVLQAVTTVYLAVLDPAVRLEPDALVRLVDRADRDGVDRLVGRVAGPSAPDPRLWSDAQVRDLPASVPDSVVLRRRSTTSTADGSLVTTGRSGVLGGFSVGLPARAPRAGVTPVVPGTAAWRGRHLTVTVEPPGASPRRSALQLRHLRRGTTLIIPRTAPSGVFELDAGILGAAPGGPGVWGVEVLVDDEDGAEVSAVALDDVPPAIVSSVPVVPARDGDRSVLDLGATRHALRADGDPRGCAVTESVAGSRLVLPLPTVHVSEAGELPARVTIEKHVHRARLIVDDQGARVEALVSGLIGSRAIRLGIGSDGRDHPTGLDLVIDELGAMRVVASSSASAAVTPAPAAPTKPHVRAKKRARAPRRGVLARLRRAVPAPLEPAVGRLARQAWAARLYRSLTRSGPERTPAPAPDRRSR